MVVCGRRPEPLDETAARAEGGRVEAQACDIREEDQVEALVDGVLERHGRIDLLVNNAGGQYLTPAEDITPEGLPDGDAAQRRRHVADDPRGRHAGDDGGRTAAAGGKIVNVTLSPHHGLPGMAHSSAARAAVENLTRVLSIEWARFGIRLTALAAGHFATDTLMTKYPKPVVEGVAETVPLGRLGTEEEFAWLVAYLARPAGDYFSGAVLTIDGARDNWFGAWPPGGLTDAAGKPLAEERPAVNVPEVRTERLLMRGWRDEDLDEWAAICTDPEVTRWVGEDDGLSREDAWRRMAYFVGHWELRGFGNWVLLTRRPAPWSAAPGCTSPRPGRASRWAGWWDGALGPGYAPEAGRAALDWARTELGADHVISLIVDDNVRSARVAEKLGMRVEGRTRIVNDQYEVRVFGIDLG